MVYNYGTTEDTKNCITNPVTCDIGVKEIATFKQRVLKMAYHWKWLEMVQLTGLRWDWRRWIPHVQKPLAKW